MKTEMLAKIIFLTDLRNSVFEKFYCFQNGEVTQLSLWKQKVQVAKIAITVQWRRTLTGQGHPRSRGQRSARRDAMVTMVSTVCLHVIVFRSKEQLKERLSLWMRPANDLDLICNLQNRNRQTTLFYFLRPLRTLRVLFCFIVFSKFVPFKPTYNTDRYKI